MVSRNIISKMILTFWIALLFISFPKAQAQDSLFSGQLSAWANFSPDNKLNIWSGARYIPAIDFGKKLSNDRLIDFEGSIHINGSAGFHPFDTAHTSGTLKPYRAWARYSSNQFELRLGLQKINFGSATLLRPLMWFDQIDPRDPLQLTDGVWGLLARYYFLNNANLWFWSLYGNEKARTWEIGKSSNRLPEFGGRFQTPVPAGEAGISYHFRKVNTNGLESSIPSFDQVGENRIGLDGKWDVGVGLWFEGSWIHKDGDLGTYTNQEIMNVGTDYTFGIGNGLNVVVEQLLISYDRQAFGLSNPVSFTASSFSYPVGLIDNVSAIVYYDWTNHNVYNFLNWKRQFNKISLYFMAFWNPKNFNLPQQNETGNLFAGKGIQIMFVYNH